MGVSPEEVRRIAELARLRPDEASVERLTAELNGILQHIRRLEEVDLTGILDSGADLNGTLPFRAPDMLPDRLDEGAPADRAPDWQQGFFVVPRLPALDGEGRDGDPS